MALNDSAELPVASDEAGLSREVYALLAQANLLRMRGCWEDATQKCMAALTLAPDHSSAQSLLGDIYENQGRHDDAIQWYHMALDIHPDSPADRLKLDRLMQMRENSPPRSRLQQIADLGSRGNLNPARRRYPNPEAMLRAVSLFAAIAVLLIVGSAYLSVHRHAALAAIGMASDQEVETKPVVLPPAADPSAIPSPGVAHDTTEQTLLDSLRSSSVLSGQGITVYDVQTDPRSASLTVTFGFGGGANGSMSQDSVLRSALRVLQTASVTAGGQTANIFTLRCLTIPTAPGSANGSSLIFVGNITSGAVPADQASAVGLTTAQLRALFTNSWWSPQIIG